MSSLVIETCDMTRKFGHYVAVNKLNLQVKKGTIYGFLGPNGCGKSTSIRMLTGLLTPTSGEVRVLGHNLPGDAELLKQKVGYMTQKFSLYENLTVEENLQFVAQIYGLPHKRRRARIAELINQYLLADKKNVRAGSLSGGQRQRLALATAVIHKPELLFLDEPTSAVDPENRREFWTRLFALSAQGTTILVSTHYMDEAERCHELAILELGHMRISGIPNQLMQKLQGRVLELRSADEHSSAAGEDLALNKLFSYLSKPNTGRNAINNKILSYAQIGQSVRLLLQDRESDLGHWQRILPSRLQIAIARPSLEDVFVAFTGKGRE